MRRLDDDLRRLIDRPGANRSLGAVGTRSIDDHPEVEGGAADGVPRRQAAGDGAAPDAATTSVVVEAPVRAADMQWRNGSDLEVEAGPGRPVPSIEGGDGEVPGETDVAQGLLLCEAPGRRAAWQRAGEYGDLTTRPPVRSHSRSSSASGSMPGSTGTGSAAHSVIGARSADAGEPSAAIAASSHAAW